MRVKGILVSAALALVTVTGITAVASAQDRPLPGWFSWGNTSDHHAGHPCIVAWGGNGHVKAEICSDGFAKTF